PDGLHFVTNIRATRHPRAAWKRPELTSPHVLPDVVVRESEPRDDVGQLRAVALFRRPYGVADVDEAGDLLVRRKPKRIEHGTVERGPASQPVRGIAERVR